MSWFKTLPWKPAALAALAGCSWLDLTGCHWPHLESLRFTEVALSSSFDLPDGPRHMVSGAFGGIVGSFAAWWCSWLEKPLGNYQVTTALHSCDIMWHHVAPCNFMWLIEFEDLQAEAGTALRSAILSRWCEQRGRTTFPSWMRSCARVPRGSWRAGHREPSGWWSPQPLWDPSSHTSRALAKPWSCPPF